MIGDVLRVLRAERRITQVQLSKDLHLSQSTYSKYERGVVAIPYQTLIELGDYFDVSIDYMFGRTIKREVNR